MQPVKKDLSKLVETEKDADKQKIYANLKKTYNSVPVSSFSH